MYIYNTNNNHMENTLTIGEQIRYKNRARYNALSNEVKVTIITATSAILSLYKELSERAREISTNEDCQVTLSKYGSQLGEWPFTWQVIVEDQMPYRAHITTTVVCSFPDGYTINGLKQSVNTLVYVGAPVEDGDYGGVMMQLASVYESGMSRRAIIEHAKEHGIAI